MACAATCRLEAAALTKTALTSVEWDEQGRLNTSLQLVDILRRASRFEEAEAFSAELTGKVSDSIIDAVLRFQIDLIRRRATHCHTVADAMPRP
jgi:hypothetical protein